LKEEFLNEKGFINFFGGIDAVVFQCGLCRPAAGAKVTGISK
jgi:hypothetical protein